MAITIRQSTNSALQYNNAGLTEYLIADNLTDKKFLTNAPGLRILNQNERSVLDFLVNDSSFVGALLKQYKDKNGVILYESLLNLSNSNINVHNSIGVDWSDEDAPEGTTTQCVTIIKNGEEILNGNFEQGIGNDFTNWIKIIPTATNHLLQSQTLNVSPTWNPSFTISANATTAPDGTMTADKIVEDDCLGCYCALTQQINLSVDAWTYSFYLKASERTIAYLLIQDGTTFDYFVTWFDLANGLVLTNQNDSAGIEDAGNGWYRCYVTRNTIDMTSGAIVQVSPTDADGVEIYDCQAGKGIFAWGGQLEIGDVMTSYKATTTTAVTEDEGSIVQAQRTNLLLRSQEFDNASWGKGNATISANVIIAPDGTLTADKLILDATNSVHEIAQGSLTLTTNEWLISVYAKYDGYQYIFFYDQFSNFFRVIFDIQNGVVQSLVVGLDAGIIDEGNGWYRCYIKFNYTSGTCVPTIINTPNTNPFAFLGNGTSGAYLWQAQLEKEIDYPSEPIVTTTTAVTVADGRNGTRAPRFNRESLQISLWQTTTTIGVEYRLQFYAKYYEGFPEISITDGTTPYGSFAITSEDYELHELIFTATGTGFYIEITSGDYSGVAIDDITLRENNFIGLTETKCFKLDSNCYEHENQIQWVNKLGGKDTFMFTGLPIKEKSIQRQNEIKYPIANNFSAPSAIYQSRSISSRESMTIFTRCENEDTARWLRDEINDCIAIYLLVGTEYYPIIPETANIQVYNENGFNYQVNMKFKFAFDVNIQTI